MNGSDVGGELSQAMDEVKELRRTRVSFAPWQRIQCFAQKPGF
jgi:hypothetical protein